jgi:hypothetical protein
MIVTCLSIPEINDAAQLKDQLLSIVLCHYGFFRPLRLLTHVSSVETTTLDIERLLIRAIGNSYLLWKEFFSKDNE